METIVDFQKNILEKLVHAYEKKGGAETALAAHTVYKRYKAIDEPIQNIEWFEEAVEILQKKEIISATWKNGTVSRLRLNTSKINDAMDILGRKLSVRQDGRQMLTKDVLHGSIDLSYYMDHPSDYVKERKDVLALSSYLSLLNGTALVPAARRERAFEIWQEEKSFLSGEGNKVLYHCGIDEAVLSMYETYEPIPYRSFSLSSPQNILFVENSATYCTILRSAYSKNANLFGKSFETVVFSAGDRILAQINGWQEPYMEKHLFHPDNHFYYFGDLDLAGIRIFLALRNAAPFSIIPFKEAYVAMADKMLWYEKNRAGKKLMPKRQFISNICGFKEYFTDDEWSKIYYLLGKGYLVPQEILTAADYNPPST